MTRSPCVECGSINELTNENKCPDCGVESIIKVVNETIHCQENVVSSTGIYFELTDPIFVPGILTNSHDIDLQFDSKNEHMLNAFTIKTDITIDNEIINSLHRASRFTNYLTFKTGMFVYHKQGRKVVNGKITDITIYGGMSMIVTSLKDVDLTNPDLYNLISNSSKENLQLAHFTTGQKALNDNNYAEAIREFFLIIENSGILEEKTYKPLRHAVSHEKLIRPTTVANLNSNFGLSWNVGDSLDPTDPLIEDFLREESKNLREISWHHINNSIKV